MVRNANLSCTCARQYEYSRVMREGLAAKEFTDTIKKEFSDTTKENVINCMDACII
ncbi:hypothetical protein SBF1_4470001 [Candidatus Desulfosporosinus infrequens]|uniref:Uncharacterized protein n=1 Tax=Candidatus Desulfosporosinus infrequens TaxID=2043169 RepID=A0A2U3LBN3_9FIRM|nr:hypothetical protein SBF1_4470001 [Candidatus Desulfosporosinus infrequens]